MRYKDKPDVPLPRTVWIEFHPLRTTRELDRYFDEIIDQLERETKEQHEQESQAAGLTPQEDRETSVRDASGRGHVPAERGGCPRAPGGRRVHHGPSRDRPREGRNPAGSDGLLPP